MKDIGVLFVCVCVCEMVFYLKPINIAESVGGRILNHDVSTFITCELSATCCMANNNKFYPDAHL